MSPHRCPRCGAKDLAFVDHAGGCFPACGLEPEVWTPRVREPDPDVERWELEESRAEQRRARWAHD